MRAPLDVIARPAHGAPNAAPSKDDALRAFHAGRFGDAAELARQVIATGGEDPLLYDMIAFHKRRSGDFAGAAEALGKVVTLDPPNLLAAANLAVCLARSGADEAARRVCERIAAEAPLSAQVGYGLGVALGALGERDEARRWLERVLEREPDHPAALGALAHNAVWEGDREAARVLAQRALQVRSGHLEAEVVMARLDESEGDFAALKAGVSALLARPDLGFENRGPLLILLSDALDAEGDYAGAFEAYREGKAHLGRMFAKAHGAPMTGAFAMAERVKAGMALPQDRVRAAKPAERANGAPERHVFLLGFPRSGTTLIEQVLASRPDTVDLEEKPSLTAAQREVFGDAKGLDRLASLDEPSLDALRATYWASVRGFGVEPQGKLFIDKQPFATLDLPLIATLFPRAKVLFAIRDPRDVVLSCFRRNFHMSAATYRFADLEAAARLYDTVMTAGARYRESYALDVHEVRYEAFVTEFDAEAHALCRFLDIDWRDEMADFARRARERRVRSISAPQVARGLYANAVGHWRHYADQLAPVLPILAPWVERFGYPAD